MTKKIQISQEKIHSIRIQMSQKNAEFNGELKRNRLKMQIKPKIAEKKKQKRYL